MSQPRTGSRSTLEQRRRGPAGIWGCQEQLPRQVPELRPQRTPPHPHVSPLLPDEALWAAAREPHFQGIGAGGQARWKQLPAGKQERWVLGPGALSTEGGGLARLELWRAFACRPRFVMAGSPGVCIFSSFRKLWPLVDGASYKHTFPETAQEESFCSLPCARYCL